ncbi:hypothetical protein [Microcoleus sp. herbarium14]|uniref:hypothetical protein n=1 Tax=Microcoleus sp. herbarium14 TaxID=3055439 RepID=UPI002FD42E91
MPFEILDLRFYNKEWGKTDSARVWNLLAVALFLAAVINRLRLFADDRSIGTTSLAVIQGTANCRSPRIS